MVKSYLRYVPAKSFGVVASTNSNLISSTTGQLAISPSLNDVVIWDTKKSEAACSWHDEINAAEVTCIARSNDGSRYSVG
jgi:U3 small nucleolar RNA-associated protein 12